MAHSRTAQLILAALISSVLAALALSPFATAGKRGSERFDGVCEMSGTVRHDPPLTTQPAPTEVRGRFTGTCSGELTDRKGRTRQVKGARASYRVRDASGALSCLGGTATGKGSLRFARGHDIQFTLTERRPAPGVAVVKLKGTAGGTATNSGTVSPDEDLMELNERCNGAGVRTIRGDARIVAARLSG